MLQSIPLDGARHLLRDIGQARGRQRPQQSGYQAADGGISFRCQPTENTHASWKRARSLHKRRHAKLDKCHAEQHLVSTLQEHDSAQVS
jgi:hypothetical protein